MYKHSYNLTDTLRTLTNDTKYIDQTFEGERITADITHTVYNDIAGFSVQDMSDPDDSQWFTDLIEYRKEIEEKPNYNYFYSYNFYYSIIDFIEKESSIQVHWLGHTQNKLEIQRLSILDTIKQDLSIKYIDERYRFYYIESLNLYVLNDRLSQIEYICNKEEYSDLINQNCLGLGLGDTHYYLVEIFGAYGESRVGDIELCIDEGYNAELKVELSQAQNDVEQSQYDIIPTPMEVILPEGIKIEDMESVLHFKKAVILKGPPGTGKTRLADYLAYQFFDKYAPKDPETSEPKVLTTRYLNKIQFSQDYSYNDFIEGLQPNKETGNWEMVPGVFKRVCEMAKDDSDTPYILIIDELNRANVESVIGEMLNLIENRGSEIITKSGSKLSMPKNVYIIATMNTIDRGSGKLDMATISRFAEFNIPPAKITSESIIKSNKKLVAMSDEELASIKELLDLAIMVISDINSDIASDLTMGIDTKGLQIGLRSLFTEFSNLDELKLAIKYDLKPEVLSREPMLGIETYNKIIEKITELDDIGG